MVTPGNNKELIIPNGPINLNDAELGRCLETRHTYFCCMIVVLGVVIQMKVKKTTTPMTHTTDAELKANFEGSRYLIPIQKIFAHMGIIFELPSDLYCDNRAVFSIIKSERMTPRCRHFDLPIAFLHANKNKVFSPKLVKTDMMWADMGTKPNTPTTLKRFKYWSTGERFLPNKDHEHYFLLQMEFYEKSFDHILRCVKNSSNNKDRSLQK